MSINHLQNTFDKVRIISDNIDIFLTIDGLIGREMIINLTILLEAILPDAT